MAEAPRRVSEVRGWDQLSAEDQAEVNRVVARRNTDGIPGASVRELDGVASSTSQRAAQFISSAVKSHGVLLPELTDAPAAKVAALHASDWKGDRALTSDRFSRNSTLVAVHKGEGSIKPGDRGEHITILRRALMDIHQAYATAQEGPQAAHINRKKSPADIAFSLQPFRDLKPTNAAGEPVRDYDEQMVATLRTFQKFWNAGHFRWLTGYANDTLKLPQDGVLDAKTLAALDMAAPPMGIYEADEEPFTKKVNGRTTRYIALTFDDGPSAQLTPRLLDFLKQKGVPATFYLTGLAQQNPELVRRMVNEGHLVGNHTFSHPPFGKLSTDQVREEVDKVQEIINTLLGHEYPLRWTRPPGGTRGYVTQPKVRNVGASQGIDVGQAHHADRVYKERGLREMHWQVDSFDWKLPGKPRQVVDNIMNGLRHKGGVILMHDIQPQTIDAMLGTSQVKGVLQRIEEHNQAPGRAYDLVITNEEELFRMKYPEETAGAEGKGRV